MNNKKPDSLFQSMEKWIELYRDINTCTHDQAHDAFEAWGEKLRGESSDQTTTLFHEAVKASFEEMLKGALQPSSEDGWMERTLDQAKRSLDSMVEVPGSGKPRPPVSEMLGSPKGFLISETVWKEPLPQKGSWLERKLKDHPETLARILELTGQGAVTHDHSVKRKLFAPGSLDRVVDIDDDIVIEFNVKTQDQIDVTLNPQVGIKESGPIGGPLLELSYGRQPPRRPFGKAEFGGPVPIGVPDNAPIGGPLLDTGKDPLGFNELEEAVDELTKKIEDGHQIGAVYIYPPAVTAAELRAQLGKVKADAEEVLSKATEDTHPSAIKYAQGALDMVTCRLRVIDEMELREKEQQGHGNSRGRMTTEETRLHMGKIISEQERILASLTDEFEIQLVKGNIESARRRLTMLDEVEAREKGRSGKRLSLTRK